MRAIFAALAGAAALCSAACTPSPQTRTEPAHEPALWRIHDSDSEIWLFGTAHLLPEGVNWQGERFQAAFGAAEELVLETDADGAQAQAATLADRYGVLPYGETLDAKLDPAARAQLVRVAQRFGIDPRALQTLRPWRAALTLSFAYARTQGLAMEHGVETELMRQARERNLRLSHFESPEQQIRTLADLPSADETHFLVSTMQEIEAGADDSGDADRAWARGDTQALQALLGPQMHASGPEVYAALITRRNAAWADDIARRLEGRGRIFIAVGAAHLIGPDSVVALLRARGIAVEGP